MRLFGAFQSTVVSDSKYNGFCLLPSLDEFLRLGPGFEIIVSVLLHCYMVLGYLFYFVSLFVLFSFFSRLGHCCKDEALQPWTHQSIILRLRRWLSW